MDIGEPANTQADSIRQGYRVLQEMPKVLSTIRKAVFGLFVGKPRAARRWLASVSSEQNRMRVAGQDPG